MNVNAFVKETIHAYETKLADISTKVINLAADGLLNESHLADLESLLEETMYLERSLIRTHAEIERKVL